MAISSALGSSALLPAGLGFRNLLINGDFRINQRGFTSTTTSGTYGFDRWLMLGTGGTTTYSAQSFSLGNAISGYEPTNHARVVTTGQTTSGSLSILIQKIENVRTFAGQQVSVSFWARSGSGTPKVAVELYQDFGSGGSPSSGLGTLAGTPTLSTSWTRFTLNVTLPSISGKTLGSNPDSNLGVNIWVSAGSDFNARTGSLGIQSNTFDIWGVQVEQNLQPTPFEQRPIGVELALCQRYYWRITNDNSNTFIMGSGSASTATNVGVMVPHPVRMRAKANVIETNGAYPTDLVNYYGGLGSWAISSVSGVDSSFLQNTTTSGLSTNRPHSISLQSTNGYLALGAEL